MALTQEEARAIAREVGFTGEFGGGAYNNFVQENNLSDEVARRTQEIEAQKAAGSNILSTTQNQVLNPSLPVGTQLTPIQHQVTKEEMIKGPTALDPTGANIQAPNAVTTSPINTTTATAAQINAQGILDQSGLSNAQAPQIDPTLTTPVDEAVAVTGQVSDLATVKGQLASLFGDINSGEVPQWAVGAYNKAQEEMAARGLGASSIAAGAITTAYMNSAIEIASQDAATYFQMDIQNLNNKQQAMLENVRMKQQNMLTDVSIQNAAAQFNAENQTQVQQFVASLISSISSQNAQLATSVSTFNAAENNKIQAQLAQNDIAVQQFNAQMESQIKQYNSQLAHQREVFNSEMAYAIEQSNVLWRRAVNTENTAQINAANQANVQNLFNMSQAAQNNLWQQWRDEAAWAYNSAEKQLDRDFNLVMAANNRSFAESRDENAWLNSLGGFAFNVLESYL